MEVPCWKMNDIEYSRMKRMRDGWIVIERDGSLGGRKKNIGDFRCVTPSL
jgi:hypothetical protein